MDTQDSKERSDLEAELSSVLNQVANYLPEAELKPYIEASGQYCPVCKGHDISGGYIEIDGGVAWQEVDCGECGATWTDEYDLARVSNVRKGEDNA